MKLPNRLSLPLCAAGLALVACGNLGTTDPVFYEVKANLSKPQVHALKAAGITEIIANDAVGNDISMGDDSGPAMTPDGRFIAFTRLPANSAFSDVYIWDAEAGSSELVSVNREGTGGGNRSSDTPRISADGRYRVEIIPRAGAANFVDEVRSVVPAATGLPVVQREAGRAVVGSFQQAFITAFVLISSILALLLRNWCQVVIVLIPLVTAGLATVAVMVLIGQPFNFANVIALPLLLGVGVDNGIHMVHRWRSTGEGLLASSTSGAIFYSALTTIASFGNLAFSSHPGSASMGTVLSIGMIFTTVFTFVLIPALLPRLR